MNYINPKEIYYWVFDAARVNTRLCFKVRITTIRRLSATEYGLILNKVFAKEDIQCMFFQPPEINGHIEVIGPEWGDNAIFFDYVFEGVFNSSRPFTYDRGIIQDELRQDI